jgi:HK97 family phage major capsid protein
MATGCFRVNEGSTVNTTGLLTATRSGTVVEDGERIAVRAGKTRVSPEVLDRPGWAEFFDAAPAATRSRPRPTDRDGTAADRKQRRDRLAAAAGNPRNRESGDGPKSSTKPRRTVRTATTDDQQLAQRAIDSAYEDGVLGEVAGQRLVDLIERDRFNLDARYIAAISSPAYERAFAKKIGGVNGAEAALEADEAEAMLAVGRSMSERALAIGEGSTGGFAVPLSLDPTVLLTNDGAINPIRDLATVSTISGTTWQGVSSAGVKAEFAAEAASAKDGAPTLGQPEITPEKATIYVPYSIESALDWPGLAAELGKLFADARSVKEAEVFAVGKGSENIPQGLVTGATKVVETKTKEVIAPADVYALQEALAPRWQPRATFLGANAVGNAIHRMVANADAVNAPLMSDDRQSILGKPYHEVSTMSAKITTKKEKPLVYGDIGSAFRIVDRLGLTVEQIPLVMKEGVPTGQRALYAYFRVGSEVVIPEAVQVLMVKE